MTLRGLLAWIVMVIMAFIIIGLFFIQIGKNTIELMNEDNIIYIQLYE